MLPTPSTRIVKNAPYVTEINFLHVAETNQDELLTQVCHTAGYLAQQPGMVAVNVLRSTDGTRVCTYVQWQDAPALGRAHAALAAQAGLTDDRQLVEAGSGKPRLYDVVYADDRSVEGVTTIATHNPDTIFINEITTQPGSAQARLLELVIANNERDSKRTPGYRSANFHRSHDGQRAVNYSLWDTQEHLIEAITLMADEDVNLDETMTIATPDFRFYTLVYAAHR